MRVDWELIGLREKEKNKEDSLQWLSTSSAQSAKPA